jgi:hypothetical protein
MTENDKKEGQMSKEEQKENWNVKEETTNSLGND